MDLSSFLLFNYLDEASSKPNIDADLAAQQIEQFLSSDKQMTPEEEQAIQSYLQMDFDARRDLNPAIHEWMLERIALKPWSLTFDQASKIAEVFFIGGAPTLSLLAVNALLAISASHDSPQSLVSLIWESTLNQPHPVEELNELADILLDLQFLSIERNPVNQALRELANMDRRLGREQTVGVLEFTDTLRARLLVRAESLSSELARELRAIAHREDSDRR